MDNGALIPLVPKPSESGSNEGNPFFYFASSQSSSIFTYHSLEEAVAARERDPRFDGLKPITRDLWSKEEEPLSEDERANVLSELNDLKVYALDDESVVKIPDPVRSFADAYGSNPDIMTELSRNGLSAPSPVQCQVWPLLLSGIDCVGVSQTGSGKTLAFLLPAFLHIEAQLMLYSPGEKIPCPFVLVLSPTRELALQIKSEVKKYSYNGYKSVCLYGGGDRKEQLDACGDGVHIVIATPGRLADLAYEEAVQLSSITYVVIDEADRMLDMGFEPQIRRIMIEIRPDRIMCLTSATWPPAVRALAGRYTKAAVMCVVGTLDLTACNTVTQYVENIDNIEEKKTRLFEIIKFLENTHGPTRYKVIVFVSSKAMADMMSVDLCREGISAQAMHGSRSQRDREAVLADFRKGRSYILIATDVASRGIDVPDVSHVINFDFPSEIEEYVHRIGRTGRAGRSGEAMSFFARRNWDKAGDLISIMQKNEKNEIPPWLEEMARRYEEKKASGTLRPPRPPFRRREENKFMGY